MGWCSGGELEELLQLICLEDWEEEVEWDLLSFLEFPEWEWWDLLLTGVLELLGLGGSGRGGGISTVSCLVTALLDLCLEQNLFL